MSPYSMHLIESTLLTVKYEISFPLSNYYTKVNKSFILILIRMVTTSSRTNSLAGTLEQTDFHHDEGVRIKHLVVSKFLLLR